MKSVTHLLIHSVALLVVAAAPLAQAQTAAPAAAAEPKFKAHVLTRAELDALLAKPDSVMLIDVRRPDELTNIGGFPVYLSVQNADIEKSTAWIPKDRTIVTISNHAARAGKAADLLASKGFKVAGAVGAQNYEADGGKLTRVVKPASTGQAAAAVK